METNNKTATITQEKDRNAISLDLMNRMKMHGMAAAFRESHHSTVAATMTVDSFVSMLLVREWDYRSEAAIGHLISQAGFRYKAFLEEIDYSINRGLDRNQVERLASLDFIRQGQNLFITGSSGTGKSCGIILLLTDNAKRFSAWQKRKALCPFGKLMEKRLSKTPVCDQGKANGIPI